MKRFGFTFLILVQIQFCIAVQAQSSISADGKFMFVLNNASDGGINSRLDILSTTNSWKEVIFGATEVGFSADGKTIFYIKDNSFWAIKLGDDNFRKIEGVISYKAHSRFSKYVALKKNGATNSIEIWDFDKNRNIKFSNILEYKFAPFSEQIVLASGESGKGIDDPSLITCDLKSLTSKIIFHGPKITFPYWEFGENDTTLYFMKNRLVGGNQLTSIWKYSLNKIVPLIDEFSKDIESNLKVSSEFSFVSQNMSGKPFEISEGGQVILFYVQEKTPLGSTAKMDINAWSYLDPSFKGLQINDLSIPSRYIMSVNTVNMHVTRIEEGNDIIARVASAFKLVMQPQFNDKYALLFKFSDDILRSNHGAINEMYSMYEYNWNKALYCDLILVDLATGERKTIMSNVQPFSASYPYARLSPQGRYVLVLDAKNDSFIAYNTEKRFWSSLTINMNVSWVNGDTEDYSGKFYEPKTYLNLWEQNDKSVIVKDGTGDYWELSTDKLSGPKNITKDVFKPKDVHFNLAFVGENDVSTKVINRYAADDQLVFEIIGTKNGENNYKNKGYCRIMLKGKQHQKVFVSFGEKINYQLIQIKDSNYLMSRQTYANPLDFVCFLKSGSVFPVNKLIKSSTNSNGITKELLTWKAFDGTICRGVLQKPKHFDPQKKYPVIFWLYEKMQGNLNQYVDYSAAISDDYLIFYPDIHYKLGYLADGVYNCVVSGAEYLVQRPYVNSQRLGVEGTSFGAYETNCLVTRTNIFAAAIASCGYSNMFSSYIGEDVGLRHGEGSAESGQNRIGVDPWSRMDLYIANSPVFHANKITTPLLLLHGKLDTDVPYYQSVEMFKALRRLQKKVWLISGDNIGHAGPHEFGPYAKQFFDHYLKGEAPRKWLTGSISARDALSNREIEFQFSSINNLNLQSKEQVKTPQQKDLLKEKVVVTNNGEVKILK